MALKLCFYVRRARATQRTSIRVMGQLLFGEFLGKRLSSYNFAQSRDQAIDFLRRVVVYEPNP
jgi:hypothetical protein